MAEHGEDDGTRPGRLLPVAGARVLLARGADGTWDLLPGSAEVGPTRPYGVVRSGPEPVTVVGADPTGVDGAEWVPVAEVDDLPPGGPLGAVWPRLRECLREPVLVVDCANVMGSRPDGWWRDRAGAAARLRDRLARADGFPGLPPFDPAHPRVVLVVEGKARHVEPVPGVEVVSAPGSGDDTIVDVAAANPGCTVVTADRELRGRCAAVGARLTGPGWLLERLDDEPGNESARPWQAGGRSGSRTNRVRTSRRRTSS
ncbi:ADP-ribose pyrophosphatase [Actinokineospora auranticolor]|uniref:YacP-like NYN domain-containing protein n=1 Tax=Actinokineospora auranticolor TaxID=155976 RepID=A0A2S6GD03_9PSEU|nr:ADP-ribose pyrophosphatase [Actinokineospora auranticolor]PPK63108.1 hypothetical protein CLV40_13241 [Actinokineospora auranticolor]